MTELLGISHHQVILGIAQAAAAVVLCLAVVFLCRRFAVHVERETVVSLARGFVQMVAVGALLATLLHGSLAIAICILLGMTIAAGVTAARRAPGLIRLVFSRFSRSRPAQASRSPSCLRPAHSHPI